MIVFVVGPSSFNCPLLIDNFPATYPSLQYGPIRDGSYYNEPTEGAVEAAKKLLEEGSVLPADVIYQSNERIGVYYDELDPPPGIGSTMYFGKWRIKLFQTILFN